MRLYFSDPLPGSTTATIVLSALSRDALGTSFDVESDDLLEDRHQLIGVSFSEGFFDFRGLAGNEF